jgi:aminopeptidase N
MTTGGVRLSYLGEGASASMLEAVFAPTPAMVAFFEGKAGLPLPGGRYTQLLTPGAEAQEVAGFSLIGRKVIEPMLADPQEDWAIAHELAHQWWGNPVTCRDLSEFWLNEGVTTFMVAAWKEHRWGRPAYERELELARRRFATAEKAGFDVPLAFAGAYPSLGVRRAVQYYKGALFLDALRTEMGDRAFWDGLRRYTREHAGGVVDSRDLQRAMEQSSRSDLRPLFERWVYGTSTPRTAAPSASLQAHGR